MQCKFKRLSLVLFIVFIHALATTYSQPNVAEVTDHRVAAKAYSSLVSDIKRFMEKKSSLQLSDEQTLISMIRNAEKFSGRSFESPAYFYIADQLNPYQKALFEKFLIENKLTGQRLQAIQRVLSYGERVPGEHTVFENNLNMESLDKKVFTEGLDDQIKAFQLRYGLKYHVFLAPGMTYELKGVKQVAVYLEQTEKGDVVAYMERQFPSRHDNVLDMRGSQINTVALFVSNQQLEKPVRKAVSKVYLNPDEAYRHSKEKFLNASAIEASARVE